MAARRRQNKQQDDHVSTSKTERIGARGTAKSAKRSQQRTKLEERVVEKKTEELNTVHLAPLSLVVVVMICSGFLWILAFRDLMSTGRAMLGDMDDAYVHFTKSTQFFDVSKGWLKSKAGGLSAVASVTTDENNMGGLFIRKLGGAAGLAVHSQKLMPLLFQPEEAHFGLGHYRPMLIAAAFGNIAIAALNYAYLEDLNSAECGTFGLFIISTLIFEAIVILMHVIFSKCTKVLSPSPINDKQKTPNSLTCKIVSRTVAMVSGVTALVCGRDLFFPGRIISHFPHDDIYLEWTGAFLHSPPLGSPEEDEHALESPLYVGDKYVSQMTALCMLVCCMHKFVTAFFIRYGTNNSGEIKCRIIWRCQALGGALIVFVIRIFALAAKSASLDLRWHLMSLTYEVFIIGLYAFF